MCIQDRPPKIHFEVRQSLTEIQSKHIQGQYAKKPCTGLARVQHSENTKQGIRNFPPG